MLELNKVTLCFWVEIKLVHLRFHSYNFLENLLGNHGG